MITRIHTWTLISLAAMSIILVLVAGDWKGLIPALTFVVILAISLRLHQEIFTTMLFILPVVIGLVLVWGGIVEGAPDNLQGGRGVGFAFAAFICIRLLIFCLSMMIMYRAFSEKGFATSLRRAGFKGGILSVLISSWTTVPELIEQSKKVYEVRYARGYFSGTNFIAKSLQLPKLMVPIVLISIRSAIARARLWEARGLIKRIQEQDIVRERFGWIDIILVFFQIAVVAFAAA